MYTVELSYFILSLFSFPYLTGTFSFSLAYLPVVDFS